MTLVRAIMAIGFLGLLLVGCNSSTPKTPGEGAQDSLRTEGSKLVYLDVTSGRIEIELLPNLAPNHVRQIKALVNKGFYDGIVFHRVIEGFMAQTGDPTGTGKGKSDLPNIKAEFTKARFERGVLGMARSSSPDSANSQFFIMLAPGEFLNGQYTVFGKVVKGMEFVDAIKKGDKDNNGSVKNPDKIIKMQMVPNS